MKPAFDAVSICFRWTEFDITMKSLGICFGAATLSLSEISRNASGTLSEVGHRLITHHGNPHAALKEALNGLNIQSYTSVAATGRKFREYTRLASISEPEAVEKAMAFVRPDSNGYSAVVSAGAETFMVYGLGKNGQVTAVYAGNKCASGTGEFFLQQIRRMDLSLDEAVKIARRETPYAVSGRCSVFCKSDCTHATNKGIPRERVTAGLCRMMAGKILELVRPVGKKGIVIIGGCARNHVMIDFLKTEIPDLFVPEQAPYFEALGCALWALENKTFPLDAIDDLFTKDRKTFAQLPPLKTAEDKVTFKESRMGTPESGDRCIIGLDVGSTTTKAVLLRTGDNQVLASIYLRTNADPVGASRACYAALRRQLGELSDAMHIVGIGVTGSGRQIAGLHAMTDGVINEIIAHASAALFFDRDVDTIFEIGGQDAKYTYITNGVASDYAMNEACSAGTGSFLEEAARETLNIEMEQIASAAMQGTNPPNFNDQCAAFISSDIKNAFQEGIETPDIVAGLVYSICMNYANRVKGNRPVGKKVFMQGGVCCNRAVPLAMAALTGKDIIVPPDPHLMGAFGVALEVDRKIELGLMKEKAFSLRALENRRLAYGKSFICKGGGDRCDRKCEISRIIIDGAVFPFGGACNRWINIRARIRLDSRNRNHVSDYERMAFDVTPRVCSENSPSVGINKSFMVNTYFPLYHEFFTQLGFRVLIPEKPDPAGIEARRAPFCYPAELAHGFFHTLVEQHPDYIFLPQFKTDLSDPSQKTSVICPLSQGEPYYLASAFKHLDHLAALRKSDRILQPVLDFSNSLQSARRSFADLARPLRVSRHKAAVAFDRAVERQKTVFNAMVQAGNRILKDLEKNPDEFAIVILGRVYNSLVSEAHMGIPHKLASRGIRVIPLNFLPLSEETAKHNMYWAAGQRILKTARFIQRHSQLFGCYITNFSCGPDSFLLGYFRDIMGKKPSLTLELDSHTADAGLETRIEAFLDIIVRYRELEKRKVFSRVSKPFIPAGLSFENGHAVYIDSMQKRLPISDPRVHLVFPSMGSLGAESLAAAFRRSGIRASALPPSDNEVLKTGRAHSSCKECLPLQLTTGTLFKHIENRDPEERTIYFMPTASGPCRYGQYSVFLNDLIVKQGFENVALMSLSAENSYAGLLSGKQVMNMWRGIVLSSIMEEIQSTLMVNAVDCKTALDIFDMQWQRIIRCLETPRSSSQMVAEIQAAARVLSEIPVNRSWRETPRILLSGEIFVRHDGISRQYLPETLARKGFAVKVSSVIEWVYYTDWCVRNRLSSYPLSLRKRLYQKIRNVCMRKVERTFRKILAQTGLCSDRNEDVDHIIQRSRHLISPHLVGEAILTTGAAITEILDPYCGVIAVGPFGCMPNRLSEAILNCEMNISGKRISGNGNKAIDRIAQSVEELPFLAIETDGNPFPPILQARLEAFLLQSSRIHEILSRVSADS